VRICKSEKLLAKSQKTILEVAYDVGFSSVSYFNRIFKRYKNCTPTEYRRAQYENQ
ncbi:MAG: helix-turn-helix transcriptional regulator, partial [Clostridia bacterium]|nr:helix-turn-helix transcriptional regulator [Clostridia bacterium]